MIFDFLSSASKESINPVTLIMIDGWGLAPPTKGNAISLAKTPNMDSYYKLYPHGELIAAGESVGLPANEVGNSEVGHLTAGVGRVIYQSLKRINVAIETGEFYENRAINDAIKHAVVNKSNLHVLGLASSGNVHASLSHLFAVLQTIKNNNFNRVYLHLFTDGRDAPPQDGINTISQVQERLDFMKIGQIASVSGRYYAMDRDARWDRVERVYKALTEGIGARAESAVAAIQASYQQGKTDEFIEPTIIGNPAPVSDNDACIFFNFRVDRARELAMTFTLSDFETMDITKYGFDIDVTKEGKNTFTRNKIAKNLFFVTMSEYQKDLPVAAIAFPPMSDFPDSIPEVISKLGFKQFHLAESEKERMVGYYFNGMTQKLFEGEDITIIPSPKVPTYDKYPEMSAFKIAKEYKKAISKNKYKFIVLNLANPDMVAHSGNIEAAIKAIEAVDKVIGDMVNISLKYKGTVLISADHGNAEEMISFANKSFYYTTDEGTMNTDHSGNPVPVIIISESFRGQSQKILKGTLADLAPTILGIMNIPVPEVMTGKDLLKQNG